MDLLSLENEIVDELKIELEKDADFNEEVLRTKVKGAIREVRMKRNYKATSWNAEHIAEDLYSYASIIKNVALYDYNQIGAEFQTEHSENSVKRGWVKRETLFADVPSFVEFVG